MELEDISYQIRGALFDVYNELGPGLLESIYAEALAFELNNRFLNFEKEIIIPVLYKGEDLNLNLRADFIIEGEIIIELKSIEELKKVHHKQLLTYLKLSNKQLGFLVNFNEGDFSKGIIRKVNNFVVVKKDL